MIDDKPRPEEDQLAELLYRYEESLTERTRADDSAESMVSQNPARIEELQFARRGVDAVARVRRRWTPQGSESQPNNLPNAGTNRPVETEPLQRQTIARFEILSELGRGGLGVVFLANDPRLRRRVALKVPRLEASADADLRARFMREAEAAARLNHSNIVNVFEVGESGPVCYIAAEYCPGPTLRQWIKQLDRPPAARVAASWATQLAQAVQHAHGRGVLHRDIKPSNVLLVPESQESDANHDAVNKKTWQPKLADFGMAKLIESEATQHEATRSGALIGTIPYMAPEQAEGRTNDIDVRSDVYGLGALLYEMLTTRPPYQGDTDADTLRQLLFTDIEPPSRLRAGVPQDLEAICLRCLAKNPDRRYATAQELSDDLERYLDGQPTVARPPSIIERLTMWVRRHPAAAFVVATMLFAILSVLTVVGVYSARLSGALQETAFQRDRAEREADLSEQMLYSADVQLAYDAWASQNLARTVDILQRHIPAEGEIDHREFAWHYLWKLCHPPVDTLLGHTDEVFSIAFSPDGTLLASASKDRTVRLWELATGNIRFVMKGHASEVTSVAFSPDGNRLVSGSEDRTVRVWRVSTGECIGVLGGHLDHVLSVAFAPDGRWIASGSRDTNAKVWNAKTLELITTIDEPKGGVSAVDFSPNQELAVADSSGYVHVFHGPDWAPASRQGFANEDLLTVDFSHYHPWIATAGRNRVVRVLEYSTSSGMSPVEELMEGHTYKIQSIAFSPSDNLLASAGREGALRIWNLGNLSERPRSLLGHKGRVWDVAWSCDGRRIASAGADHTVKVWRRAIATKPYDSSPAVRTDLSAAAMAPDGKQFATTSQDGLIRAWDPTDLQVAHVVPHRVMPLRDLAYSGDGQKIAASDIEGTFHVWTPTSGEHRVLKRTLGQESPVVAWSPVKDQVALTLDSRNVAVVEANSGEELLRLTSNHNVSCLQFSPDGRRLATNRRLWELSTGKLLFDVSQGSFRTFSPDGRVFVAVDAQTILLLDGLSGEETLQLLCDSDSSLGDVAISPDGRTLAVIDNNDVSVILWDMKTGQELSKLNVDFEYLKGITFSPDASRLIALASIGSDWAQIIQWSIRATKSPNTSPESRHLFENLPDASHPLHTATGVVSRYVAVFEPTESAATSALDEFRVAQMYDGEAGSHVLSTASIRRRVRFASREVIDDKADGAHAVALRDMDNDGDKDVIAALYLDGQLVWYENDGASGFTSKHTIDDDLPHAEDVVIRDFDADGWLDVLASSRRSGVISWYRNERAGSEFTAIEISQTDTPHTLVSADLDNDGEQDVIWTAAGLDEVGFALNKNGVLGPRLDVVARNVGSSEILLAADLDNDGDIDVVAASESSGTLFWHENSGDATFPHARRLATFNSRLGRAHVSDLNKDGKLDLVVPLRDANQLAVFENLGDGRFQQSRETVGSAPLSVHAGDLDGDGDEDLVTGSRNGAALSVYLNDGRANFSSLEYVINRRSTNLDDVEIGDLNQDRIPDLAFAAFRSGQVGWHPGLGISLDAFSIAGQATTNEGRMRTGLVIDAAPRESSSAGTRSSTDIILRITTIEGDPISPQEFRQLVDRIVVYADTDRDGLATTTDEPVVAVADQIDVDEGLIRIPLDESRVPTD